MRRIAGRAAGLARRAALTPMARFRRVSDPNFVGFDKYMKLGAYHWREIDQSPEYRRKVDAILALGTAGRSCVDLGCGDGAVMSRLAPTCSSVVGVDADYAAIRLARRHLREMGLTNTECHHLPLSAVTREAVRAPDGFDLVISLDVIEHLPDPTELVTVARALAHEGSVIAIGTPLHISDELVSPYHVREFSREEITGILSETLVLRAEHILPTVRNDGRTYEDSFFLGVCSLG